MNDHSAETKFDDAAGEAGARHGEKTGAWRVVRNGMMLAILALAAVGLVFALGG